MLRMRLASLAAAVGLGALGFLSGCSSTSDGGSRPGLFSRLCGRTKKVEGIPIDASSHLPMMSEGPMLMDPGFYPGAQPYLPPAHTPGLGSLPPTPCAPGFGSTPAPQPRLVPQPQSQPMPYTP